MRGSPPRARGKEPPPSILPAHTGITPACAGKSVKRNNNTRIVVDHPRVRGEKFFLPLDVLFGHGSPPRARGKDISCSRLLQTHGITPACAGKSLVTVMASLSVRDHPRVRGEKQYPSIVDGDNTGSPPRARGKEQCGQCWHRYDGITPACAGKSLRISCYGIPARDHPRVRGEKSSQILVFGFELGSPPRARGKGRCYVGRRDCAGITPACAGKSQPERAN